jgi:hypothetical protein
MPYYRPVGDDFVFCGWVMIQLIIVLVEQITQTKNNNWRFVKQCG